MVLHNSLFRSGTIYDVPDIIGLIERRIEWMDCNGINQWNKSHYRERYPDGYYIQAAEKGLLYVLTAKDSNRIIAGAVLLTQDVRWGQSNGKAYYVHNLVAAIGEKNAGKEILQRSGSESFSISAIRLCVLMMPNSVVSGKRGILTTLCESQLFIDGPRNRAAILLSLSRSHNRNPRFGGSIWTIRPVLIFFFHCESAASNSLTSSPPIPAVMKETSLTYSRLLSSNSS